MLATHHGVSYSSLIVYLRPVLPDTLSMIKDISKSEAQENINANQKADPISSKEKQAKSLAKSIDSSLREGSSLPQINSSNSKNSSKTMPSNAQQSSGIGIMGLLDNWDLAQ